MEEQTNWSLNEPDIAKALEKQTIDVARPCLAEIVQYGTDVLSRCVKSAEGGDEQVAILTTYRHVIEMVDACLALVAEACELPTTLILRSQFEALLSLMYLLEDDTEQRGRAWHVAKTHQKIDMHKLFDPVTPQGTEFAEEELRVMGDRVPKDRSSEKIRESWQKLESLLKTGDWAEVEEEWQRARKTRRKPNWHSLFGGPNNIRELAEHVGMRHYYDLLYRQWASTHHVMDYKPSVNVDKESVIVRRFRACDDLKTHAGLGALLGTLGIRRALRYYRPEELDNGTFARWYKASVMGHIAVLVPGQRSEMPA